MDASQSEISHKGFHRSLRARKIRPGNGTTGSKEMQDSAEEGLRAAKTRALKIDRQRPLLPLADLPEEFLSVMRFPPQDKLHPAHDSDDTAHHSPPSRDLETRKLTLVATRECDKSESFHLGWLAEVMRAGRPGMRMIPIAPHLINSDATQPEFERRLPPTDRDAPRLERQRCDFERRLTFFFFVITLGLQLSDTKVYEP